MDFLLSLYESLKSNPLLMSLIGLSGAGILTFWIKDVPRMFIQFLKREFSTTLTINSSHNIYHKFSSYIDKMYYTHNFRSLKFTNGKWGDSDKTIITIGYGFHLLFFKHRPLFLTLTKDKDGIKGEIDKETLEITKIGRNRNLFKLLLSEIELLINKCDKIEVNALDQYGNWKYCKKQSNRSLETIFIEKNKKNTIVSTLDKFVINEQWYIKHDIPYQLGILLYGPPGTGKTSIIKALATHLHYDIYYISPENLCNLGQGLCNLPEKSLLVIEDMDANTLTQNRDTKLNETSEELKNKFPASLSSILNALDGIFSCHGRILVATTNHIEKLDPALIRPGRIDLQLEIGFVNNEILESFMNNFFPNNSIDFNRVKMKSGISPAMLQNMVLQGLSADQIVESVDTNSYVFKVATHKIYEQEMNTGELKAIKEF